MRRGLGSLFLVALLGCVRDVHPVYQPETTVTYVQNITYPTTIVYPPAPAAPTTSARATKSAEGRHGSSVKGPAAAELATQEGVTTGRPPPPRPAEPVADRDLPTEIAGPGDDGWQDLFAAERDLVRRGRAAAPKDAWEQLVGRSSNGADEVDVVADVPVDTARAIARRYHLTIMTTTQGEHSGRPGNVVAIRQHSQHDGLAQLLIKVADLKAARGTLVAVAVDLERLHGHLLTVGHVAAEAAETTNDALIRQGLCRRVGRTELSCGGVMEIARADTVTAGHR